jgi:hypothetical protein
MGGTRCMYVCMYVCMDVGERERDIIRRDAYCQCLVPEALKTRMSFFLRKVSHELEPAFQLSPENV